MKSLLRCVAFVTLCFLAGCAEFGVNEQYSFRDTKVVAFTTREHARQYKLFVSLPRNYGSRTAERFPVIYLLDADYSFAMTRNLLRHFTDRNLAREAIIVGIAYPGAEDDMDVYHRARTRDYTPSFTLENGYGPEIQKLSGGGPAFLRILADEILPEIDLHYRTKPDERLIVGNSFGGVFVTYALVTQPELFNRYLIVSPSLWYDHKMIFGVAQRFNATHRALSAHVFYAVGSEENQPPPHGSMMVDDLKDFVSLMKAANLSGYESTLVVFDSETHESVFPAALSRGLRVLYGFNGESPPPPK